jgi:hypothetical protein
MKTRGAPGKGDDAEGEKEAEAAGEGDEGEESQEFPTGGEEPPPSRAGEATDGDFAEVFEMEVAEDEGETESDGRRGGNDVLKESKDANRYEGPGSKREGPGMSGIAVAEVSSMEFPGEPPRLDDGPSRGGVARSRPRQGAFRLDLGTQGLFSGMELFTDERDGRGKTTTPERMPAEDGTTGSPRPLTLQCPDCGGLISHMLPGELGLEELKKGDMEIECKHCGARGLMDAGE